MNMVFFSWFFDFWFFGRCMYGGILVFMLWVVGNVVFIVFMVKEFFKNGKVLIFELKDFNGSLFNGLKSKKNIVKVSFLC